MQSVLAGQRERAAEVQVDAMPAQPPTSRHAATEQERCHDERYPRRVAEVRSRRRIGARRGHLRATSAWRATARLYAAAAVEPVEPVMQSGHVHRISGHATTV